MSRIESERLVFSLYTGRDRNDFVDLLTDPVVMKYVDRGVLTSEQAEALWNKLQNDLYPNGVDTIWAVFAKDDGRFIGNASLRPRPEKRTEWEIGYYIKPEEWGRGFATEIAKRLVRYGFGELNFKEIFATVDTENEASRHVLEKAGLTLHRQEFDELGVFCVYRIKHPE